MPALPQFEATGGVYKFLWDDEGVMAVVRRVAEHSGYTKAEITWLSTSPGERGHLHLGMLSLNSSQSKKSLVKSLLEVHADKPWDSIIEQLAVRSLIEFRRGESTVTLRTDAAQATPLSKAISPFVIEGQPFVLYGDPCSGKSLISLLMAAAAATGQRIAGTWMRPSRAFTPLLLDWESRREDQERRLARLQMGLEMPLDGRLHYRYCAGPLSREIEAIQETVLDLGADMVFIDSLGLAAGGDLNSPQAAQEFFAALRTLKSTSVIVAHPPKNAPPGSRSIFGSQFFTALARGTADVKLYREAGCDEISVGVFPRKSNEERRGRPLGLRFAFDGRSGPITVRSEDVSRISEVEESLPVGRRIDAALRHSSHPLTQDELREVLSDVKANTISQTLGRRVKAGKVVQLDDGRYAAATEEDVVPF